MFTDLISLGELLQMATIYRRRGLANEAIALLKDIVDIEEHSAEPDKRILAVVQYNLAELYASRGMSMIAHTLYKQAIDNWNAVEAGDPLNIGSHEDSLKQMQEETERLITWVHRRHTTDKRNIA